MEVDVLEDTFFCGKLKKNLGRGKSRLDHQTNSNGVVTTRI